MKLAKSGVQRHQRCTPCAYCTPQVNAQAAPASLPMPPAAGALLHYGKEPFNCDTWRTFSRWLASTELPRTLVGKSKFAQGANTSRTFSRWIASTELPSKLVENSKWAQAANTSCTFSRWTVSNELPRSLVENSKWAQGAKADEPHLLPLDRLNHLDAQVVNSLHLRCLHCQLALQHDAQQLIDGL